MSIYATEKVPQPVIVDGVVDIDIAQRTLAVRRSELTNGYGRLLWREAHAALVRAEEGGWRTSQSLRASAAIPGGLQVASVTPGNYGMLLCRFPPGESSFSELVGKPGLTAAVGIDRSTRLFISVRFRNKL